MSRRSSTPPNNGDISEQGSSKHSLMSKPSVNRHTLKVHIVSAKLEPGIFQDLVDLVEKHGSQVDARQLELSADADRAGIIITAIHTRPRLERHVCWEVAKTKPIVTPDWLMDSVKSGVIQPCRKYAALGDLSDETERSCPKAEIDTFASTEALLSHHRQLQIPVDLGDNFKDTDPAALNHLSSFSCQRSSPLTCLNQALIEELDIIRRDRFYEGEERSMVSYARAIASIKACPYHLNGQKSPEDIAKLPYLGPKFTSMVKQFIETGKISEAQNILSSTRFLTLSLFNTIHGIGPHTARHLYSLGLRTIQDLEKYYEVAPGLTHEDIQSRLQETHADEIGVEKSIQVSLTLRYDFSQKISREEVEEINQVIMRELESIEAGCRSLVVGGYRRGKSASSDVDIVFSHMDWEHGADKVRGLCKKLIQRLHEHGLVKHVLNMSGYRPHNMFRTHHWDSLEKALTVFVLPGAQTHRRVDLIFATPAIFWTAVVGWTGSTMFERDLRLWAKRAKGLKFDSSGITRRQDSKLFFPRTEHEVFDLLGLAYVPPHLRNADL